MLFQQVQQTRWTKQIIRAASSVYSARTLHIDHALHSTMTRINTATSPSYTHHSDETMSTIKTIQTEQTVSSKFATPLWTPDFSKLSPNVQAAYLEPIRLPARYGITTCSLQMRSFEIPRLEFFADFSMRVAYYLGLSASGPVPLPKRIERWTVPKGHFIHTKSKENFERITHKRLITIKDGHPRVVETWLAYLTKHAMYGIGMKAHLFKREAMEEIKKEHFNKK